jgi:hypothetical protein
MSRSRPDLRLNPEQLRAFAKRPEVRVVSYPLGGRSIRGKAVSGGVEVVPDCVFYGRTRSLVGAALIVLIPLFGVLLVGVRQAWLPIAGAILFGLWLVISEKPPLFTYGRVLAAVRSGTLRYMGREWRTDLIGGLVVLESFEPPIFHSITHLVVDKAGQPLFCLAQHRRECGRTSLAESHLRMLDRALRVGIWRIRPGVEGDEVEFCEEFAATPCVAPAKAPCVVPARLSECEFEPSEIPVRAV